ncbi:hypothetical protein [Streptomyces gardneri]|uniref:Uncharacterized protein n=1 Tax=Streptomyces gardneri TaxID=66892 RepID=A0A4Y3REW4_9ACTN|nr:hypothetical protein [Streptomyces gardneri]GEB56306.1 hypothetical protein SGA01_19110 [Streptomyces gardneri]GHG99660.1 hypothetical protein GCM10017674_34470 [Streptomyces gardneri]
MNKRHVRAIAVAAVAVVALTGARGSNGASCGGSSSSSSSSGSNHSDNDGGSTSGGSVSGGSGSADKAIRDVTIDECKYDQATKNLVARITVKNDGSMDYDYSVSVKFKGATGGSVTPRTAFKAGIAVAAGASQSVEVTTPYIGTGDGSEYAECEVSRVSRF